MALSGRAGTVFTNNGAFELIIEWSANQNIGGNSSTVTAIMKIRGIYSWSSVSDGSASASYISINGNRKNFNAYSTVSGGQTKELGRHTVTVPHNADGTKTFNISGNHYFDIYWDGGSPLTPSLSNNYTLNTIPRASTGSGTNFVFTSNSSISISRASSGFTHKARFHVDGLFIKELTGLGTSGTFNFSDAERRSIISKMNGRSSVQCRVDLWTYSGSTQIGGMSQFTYNVTAPARAGSTANNFVISTAGFPVSITNFNSGAKYTYTATWGWGSFNKTVDVTSSNFVFPLTDADVNTMLNIIPNVNSGWGSMTIKSYYDGIAFGGDSRTNNIYGNVDKSKYSPDIKSGTTYKDTNATVVAVTGSNSIVLKQLSVVEVSIPAGIGTAKGGSTMSTIEVSLGGATASIPYTDSATTVTLKNITASTSGNLTVNVVDSRTNKATWVTPVTIIDYNPPTLSPEISRVNNYESTTDVVLGGTYSMVKVGNLDKNAIAEVTYVFKQTTSAVWSSANKLNFISSNGIISSPPNTRITLDNTYSWDIKITATDKLKVSTTYEYSIAEGVPLFFLDSELKSTGFGMFPSGTNTAEFSQQIVPYGGFKEIEIPVNSDLNDYMTAGHYYSYRNVEAQTLKNRPTFRPDAHSFNLEVITHAGVTQIYREYRVAGFEFTRSYYNGSWSDWVITGGDSGWVSLGGYFAPNFKHYGATRQIQYRRIGSLVQISGVVANTVKLSGGSQPVLINLPWEIRPKVIAHATNQGSGISTFATYVNKYGTLSAERYQGGDFEVNTWMNISILYPID